MFTVQSDLRFFLAVNTARFPYRSV